MSKGWVSLHREMQDHWIFGDAEKLRAWLIILMEVNHSSQKTLIKGKLLTCNRGESLLSHESWAHKFGKKWNRNKVIRFFKLLESDEMITTKNEQVTTHLKVNNYAKYQDPDFAERTGNDTGRISDISENKNLNINNEEFNSNNESNNEHAERANNSINNNDLHNSLNLKRTGNDTPNDTVSEHQANTKRTGDGTQLNNVNKDNNVNNENKKELSAKPPRKTLGEKVCEKHGYDLNLINRFVDHRRSIKKSVKSEKEIVLAYRDMQDCVNSGYYKTLDAAMDRLNNSTWLTIKPKYIEKDFNLTGGQKPSTPVGETFEQMERRREQEKRRDRYLRLKLRANEFGVYIDENSDFDLIEEEISNIERNRQFSEFMQ